MWQAIIGGVIAEAYKRDAALKEAWKAGFNSGWWDGFAVGVTVGLIVAGVVAALAYRYRHFLAIPARKSLPQVGRSGGP